MSVSILNVGDHLSLEFETNDLEAIRADSLLPLPEEGKGKGVLYFTLRMI